MKKYRIFLAFLCGFAQFSLAEPNQILPKEGVGPWIVNVYYDNREQLLSYTKNHHPWRHNRKAQFFVTDVTNIHEYQQLFAYGFNVEINEELTTSTLSVKKNIQEAKNNKVVLNKRTIPGFACYRTVEETYATMDNLVATYPSLASIIDIGDSWEKQNLGGNNGYDLRVLKITNSAITGTKPILFAMSSMHAREYTPAELNTRFAELLLNSYGTDADITWLVDHREIHLLLQGNPDGRKIAEDGELKRKTQNNNFCSGQLRRGVDMNRNFPFMWNQGTGSSGQQCSEAFRGPHELSENETTAVDTYIKTLFADNRGEGINDPAPDDTTGVYLDIHNVASLVLWPYGFSNSAQQAPNHTQLRTLGRKFAFYNGYRPEQSNASLGGADGASDDNAYGQLGVAAYTFELGGSGFFTSCDTFESEIAPDNLKALIYAAKVADTPYITASGPDIENIQFSNNPVASGTNLTINGVATDNHFNNVNGTEPTQNIVSVEMFIDELPWANGATPVMMSAIDGAYDSSNEIFTATIDVSSLSNGRHVIYLQATDATGTTGVVYSEFFDIENINQFGNIEGRVIDVNGLAVDAAVVTLGNSLRVTNSQGEFSINNIQGSYTLTASKNGFSTSEFEDTNVVAMQNTIQNIRLQPICGLLDESVENFNSISDAEAAGWMHSAVVGNDDWRIDTTQGVMTSAAFRSDNVGQRTDKSLVSPTFSVTADSVLEFSHTFDFEFDGTFYDGGVLEISTNNGVTWQDLGDSASAGGYNATLTNTGSNPLAGRNAWGGSQDTFTKVEVGLSTFAGDEVMVRWRSGADGAVGAGAWIIDDIIVLDPIACSTPNDIIFTNGFD